MKRDSLLHMTGLSMHLLNSHYSKVGLEASRLVQIPTQKYDIVWQVKSTDCVLPVLERAGATFTVSHGHWNADLGHSQASTWNSGPTERPSGVSPGTNVFLKRPL